jgi:hypothetical protein
LHVGAEAGLDLEGPAFATFRARLETHYRVGLSTKLSGLRESLGPVTNYSLLGNSLFTVRFAEGAFGQFRVGVGPRYWVGPEGNVSAGLDVYYGFVAQVGDRFNLSGEFDLGTLGSTIFGEVRGTIGYFLGPAELFLGWDQNWIGSVPLGGPVLGTRVVF